MLPPEVPCKYFACTLCWPCLSSQAGHPCQEQLGAAEPPAANHPDATGKDEGPYAGSGSDDDSFVSVPRQPTPAETTLTQVTAAGAALTPKGRCSKAPAAPSGQRANDDVNVSAHEPAGKPLHMPYHTPLDRDLYNHWQAQHLLWYSIKQLLPQSCSFADHSW
jgi:hypothetical protein